MDPLHGAGRSQDLSSLRLQPLLSEHIAPRRSPGCSCSALSAHTCPRCPPRPPSHTPAVPAGRRAPVQRRLPATRGSVRTTTPGWDRAASPSIYPDCAPTAGLGRGHARGGAFLGAGPGGGWRPSRPLTPPGGPARWQPGPRILPGTRVRAERVRSSPQP